MLRPDFPRRLAPLPNLIQGQRLLERIHTVPEATVRIEGELAGLSEVFKGSALENAIRVEPIENRTVENEETAGSQIMP